MYHLTWVTDHLAVGHAPMSYDELDSLRSQGIDAIVNLCGEYCDLHEIEQNHGFEVFYLPVEDDRAPDLEGLEKALDWLDEAIYLGRKVLVHCRLGIGRTGTFITSYLLRRGFGLRLAEKRLKKLRSSPSSFSQWWFLYKYGKQAGKLAIREPSLEGARAVDLSVSFSEYEALVSRADSLFETASARQPHLPMCGLETDACCRNPVSLQFIEAAYLSHHCNRGLPSRERHDAIHRAVEMNRHLLGMPQAETDDFPEPIENNEPFDQEGEEAERDARSKVSDEYLCPLSVDGYCILHSHRPIACRVFGVTGDLYLDGDPSSDFPQSAQDHRHEMSTILHEMSRRLFFALNGAFLEGRSLIFPLPHVVSGRFIQDYFRILMEAPQKP